MSRKNKQHTSKTSQRFAKGEHLKEKSASDTEKKVDVPPWLPDIQVSVGSGILLLALYIRTLHPSIPGGDSGELIVSAHEMGVAHPPGYPVFTLVAMLAMKVVPFGSPAWRVNLINAVFSAAAGAILLLATLRLTRSKASGLVAVSLFSLSQLTWTWSVTAEVFGLNNLFVALLLLLIIHFNQVSQQNQPQSVLQIARIGAFISGMSLCNQHTIVIYIICTAVWVLYTLKNKQLVSVRVLFSIGVCGLTGLLPYVYLPLSSLLGVARWTWGDHTSLHGFLTHLLRREYGTFDLGKDQEGAGLIEGLVAYSVHVWTDMHMVGPLLAIFGLIMTIRKAPLAPPTVVPVMLAVYVAFFTWRANLDVSNPLFKGVVERFWMQSDMLVALLAAVGYHRLSLSVSSSVSGEEQSTTGRACACLGSIALLLLQANNFNVCDQSGNTVVREFAQTLLDSIPRNSLVFTKGDLPTNSLRYLHLCEDVRPDLQILDQEILSYQWSLPMVGKFFTVNFPGDFWHLTDKAWPGDKKSFTFQTLLDVNYKRFSGIYVCIGMQERDESWQKGYQLWPHGPCHRVIKHKTPMDPGAFSHDTATIAYSWNYTHDGFGDTTWEKVANDEMWHAKIGSAFFLYQQAMNIKDEKAKTTLLLSSYKVYSESLVHHREMGFPSFWHKNYALVCEKLLHVEHQLSKSALADLATAHFNAYLDIAPDDPDNDKILDAIRILQQRKQMYEQIQSIGEQTVTEKKRPGKQ